MNIVNILSKNVANLTSIAKFLVLTLLSFAPQLLATQGTLDTTFNPTGTPPGTVATPIPSSSQSILNSMAIQSNGQIVAGGTATIGGNELFALARYNTNGSLDTNFGTNGIVTMQPSGATGSVIYSMAIQSNGQIVAAGGAVIGGNQLFALARYNSNGTLDTSFGTNGVVTTAIPGSPASVIYSIAIQSNGQIVAAGGAVIGGNGEFALARYNTNGTLDTNFGTNGIVAMQISGSNYSQIYSMAIQSNGQIIAGGYAIIGSNGEFALARYNTNGSLDTNFGTNGIVAMQISGSNYSQIFSIAIQSNGQIVAGGAAIIGGNGEFVLARYNTNGTLDTSFGNNGIVTMQPSGATGGEINSIAIQSNGQIVAGGYATISGANEFALARYNSNGSLDNSFGTNGIVTTTPGGSSASEVFSMAIQSNGQIVAGGFAVIGSPQFGLARYNASTSLTQSALTLALKNKYYANGTGAKQGPVF